MFTYLQLSKILSIAELKQVSWKFQLYLLKNEHDLDSFAMILLGLLKTTNSLIETQKQALVKLLLLQGFYN